MGARFAGWFKTGSLGADLSVCPRAVALSAVVAASLVACAAEPPRPPPLEISDIVIGNGPSPEGAFGVDVFVDATTSMQGFATDPNSSYRSFLEDLEGSLVASVKNVTDVRYFKFGETVREIRRQEFRDARTAGFYHEAGVFRDTRLELVLRGGRAGEPENADAVGEAAAVPDQRLVMVVTDLFQKDQDVNIIVRQVRDGCLVRPDCSVGVLAIPSSFSGTVFDARVPGYQYKSTTDPATFRTFFLLLFGPEERLMLLGDVLAANRNVDPNRLLIIGPRIVKTFSVEVTRNPAAPGVTPRKLDASRLDSAFNLRKGYSEAKISARLLVEADQRAFGFDPSRLEIHATRREATGAIDASHEVVLDAIEHSGDGIDLKLTVLPPLSKGDHTYVVDVGLGGVKGFVVPGWIADLSSPNPSLDREPEKTLDLDLLIERLIAASVLQDHHRPRIARFRILVRKL